jgi:hypothetical protein
MHKAMLADHGASLTLSLATMKGSLRPLSEWERGGVFPQLVVMSGSLIGGTALCPYLLFQW